MKHENKQKAAVGLRKFNALVSFRTVPHVCCTCNQFQSSFGGWDCRKGRANGDVHEGFQWLTSCKGWRRSDDFKTKES